MKRFPIGLTVAAVVVFAVLISLGVWQLDRLKQTNANRTAIAALATAPARPLATALQAGRDADHARVSFICQPPPSAPPTTYRYALPNGVVGWRLLTMCGLEGAPFDGILLDRGRVPRLDGSMAPAVMTFPAPVIVTGVLRKLGQKPMFGDDMASANGARTIRVIDPPVVARIASRSGLKTPAPWYVVVEQETPAAPGVQPTPVTEDTPRDNFGYALTWFGLALALAGVWGAFVWRRITAR